MLYAIAFVASFCFIGLRAAQQLNVVHRAYVWILPTSMLMAVCEVWVIANAAATGWGWIILPIGLGSGLGALAAMLLHKKFITKG